MSDADDLAAPLAATFAAAGSALIAAAFLPWFDQGFGSTMSLRELGDFMLRGRVGSGWRWIGMVAYIVPLGGSVAIIGAGLRRRRARAVAAVVAVATGSLCIAAFTTTGGQRGPAAGWFLAASGTVALAVGASMSRPRNVHDSLD